MAKTITITNGSATANLINGTYSVASSVPGYDNSTLTPESLSVVEGTNEYAFTIAADGTLTLHVTENGTAEGTPVVGATFVRTDSSGNEYGSVVTSDETGNAVFANVPYAAQGAPAIYFKQLGSDGDHEFSSEVQNITMTTSSQTIEITNALGSERTINLTDANYSGLPVDGTLTLTQ